MIGKIIFLIFGILMFVMLTGTNLNPAYQKFAEVRNTATPYADQIIENTLQYTSQVHPQQTLQPLINQLEAGKP